MPIRGHSRYPGSPERSGWAEYHSAPGSRARAGATGEPAGPVCGDLRHNVHTWRTSWKRVYCTRLWLYAKSGWKAWGFVTEVLTAPVVPLVGKLVYLRKYAKCSWLEQGCMGGWKSVCVNVYWIAIMQMPANGHMIYTESRRSAWRWASGFLYSSLCPDRVWRSSS